MLDFARGAVVRKAAGLTGAQARPAPVPPSTLTARHAGHLDLIREVLDGTTGQ